jgi:hypothetical protein
MLQRKVPSKYYPQKQTQSPEQSKVKKGSQSDQDQSKAKKIQRTNAKAPNKSHLKTQKKPTDVYVNPNRNTSKFPTPYSPHSFP